MTIAAVQVPQAPQAPPCYKLLIVDDSDDDRAYYRLLLKRRKDMTFDIREASNARDGFKACVEWMPDGVLLDYSLPDATGIDFLRACQKKGLSAAIIMTTDKGTETTVTEAMRLGAHDYMSKSAVLEGYFAQRILNAIERARMKDQVKAYQQQLEKVNAALNEFTHTVSHDLKAPLIRIIRYGELLQEEAGGVLNADCKGYVERMQANGDRLMRLIDDLLAYSRTLHSKESREETDLAALASGVVDDLEPLIEAANGAVAVGALPKAFVYPLRMRQLLQNLIGNALKYKSPERDPVITVESADDGTHYMISVRDNGMGIDEKNLQKVFKPFERLHRQEEIDGSGIGLATCQKIADMHGGRIWVESKLGEGSVFHFTISKQKGEA